MIVGKVPTEGCLTFDLRMLSVVFAVNAEPQ